MKAKQRQVTGPDIDIRTIRDWSDPRSFERGQDYYRDRSIFDATFSRNTLKASCRGSRADHYRVEATLKDGSIAEADCSCPVGDGGRCKHVVALLLTWMQKPGNFTQTESIAAALERRDKPQLIALIRQMLAQEPELEALVTLPPPTEDALKNPDIYRRRALAMLRGTGEEWDDARKAARGLKTILKEAPGFLDASEPAMAAAVYIGVADAVLDRIEGFYDDDGHLLGVLSECGDGMAACFTELPHGEPRGDLLTAMWELIRSDILQGGRDLSGGAEAAILEQTTSEEKRTVLEWAREAIAVASGWSRQALGRLVLALMSDDAGADEAIAICRRAGMGQELIERLLEIGRADEAIQSLVELPQHLLLEFAKLFDQHKLSAEFEAHVASRAQSREGAALWDWLRSRCEKRGDKAGSLRWAEQMFAYTPSLIGLATLEEYATPIGRWEEVRRRAMALLEKNGRRDLLVDVALADGDLNQAISLITPPIPRGSWISEDLVLKVARAAEGTLPARAAAMYRQRVEAWIDLQGRENYTKACDLLVRIARLLRATGQEEEWEKYITAMKVKHKAKKLLREAMEKARL